MPDEDRDHTTGSGRDRPGQLAPVLLAVAGVFVLLAWSTAGLAGVLLSVSALALILVLVLLLGVPTAPAPAPRRAPPEWDQVSRYPSYQKVLESLSWSQVSPRHYDLVTRPALQRLLASRLSDRHGVDLWNDPAAARSRLGADLWFWVDPTRPARGDSQPPGTDAATLTRLVDRLESL